MVWAMPTPQCACHRLRSANETTGTGLEPPRRSPSEGTAIADSQPPRPQMGKPRLPLSHPETALVTYSASKRKKLMASNEDGANSPVAPKA